MATIDQRFICASDLELYMAENASGLPLSGGIVTFYSDVNRTVLKPVYQLTGTPGNYNFAPLNNPCTLSNAGTFQDALGNNIVPYYYPFTGTPDDNTGIQELYYVTVVNSGFVPQFVRQAWPPGAGSGVVPVSDDEIDNYIPNGQFLSHNNWLSLTEPPYVQYSYPISGAQTVNAQAIAQGGWNFVYTNGTTATFNNSFIPIPESGGWGINSFPRFLFNFVCTSIGGGSQTRDLRIQWPDINKFSSGNPPGTTPYTLFFDAKSNDTNTYTFTLFKVYYFGTGGTPNIPIEEFIANISIGPGNLKSQNINNIIFSANLGTIGDNGDDYVALSLRGPNGSWNIAISDFVLAQGNENFLSFPVQTNDQMLSRGVAGWMPTPDPTGMDLYLPLILTPQGMTFDHSIVGQIVEKTQSITNIFPNELMMNGASFAASQYSTVGIPYKRLMNFLLLNSPAVTIGSASILANTVPMYGTGPQFVTLYNVSGQPTEFYIQMNTTAAGGVATAVSASISIAATSANNYYTATVNTVPSAGDYWTFTSPTSGLIYNVWYTFNGSGTAPSIPTGANIAVALITGDTTTTTATKTISAVNQYQFLLPNLAGLFLRGYDPTGIYDLDFAARSIAGIMFNNTSFVGTNGAGLGSNESQAFLQHTHAANASSGGQFLYTGTGGQTLGTTGAPTISTFEGATTGNSSLGGTETRPVNFAVNYFIKY